MTGFRLVMMFCIICSSVCLAGCSENLYVKTDRPIVEVPQEVPKKPQAGSLWPGENAVNSLFADRKARYVNDIVTILINEDAEGENNASTNTSRDTSTTAGITSLLGLEKKILEQNRRMGTSIGVGGSSSNSLKGEGKTTRDSNLKAKISARVIKTLGNGNLVIEGRRQLTVNAEDQYIIITGIVRPDDITSDNIILSQYIADAKIIYTGKGVIDDKMRPGWLTKVVDWVWPF